MKGFLFIILAGTLVLNIILATIIIRRGRIGLWFGLIIYGVAIWNFCLLLFDFLLPRELTIPALEQLYFWAKITLITPIIIPALYLHFALEYTKNVPLSTKIMACIYIPTLVLLLFIPSIWNFGYLYESPEGELISRGEYIRLYIPFTIYFILYFAAGLTILSKNIKYLSIRSATQIRYIIAGTIFAAAVGITTNSILPLLDRNFITLIGSPASIIFSLSVSYAILKHRFMDIRVVINKSVVYLFLTAIFGGLTIFFTMLLGNRLSTQFSTNILYSAGVVAVVIALAFPLLYTIVQFVVDKIIWRPNAHYPKMLMVSEYALARCETVYGLAQEAQETIRESLHADSTLFVLNKFTHFFESGTPSARPLTRSQTNTLITFFRESDDFVLADDIDRLAAKTSVRRKLARGNQTVSPQPPVRRPHSTERKRRAAYRLSRGRRKSNGLVLARGC